MEIDTPDDLAVARLLAQLIEADILAPAIPDPLSGIVFDFDGVMTDDRVYVDENGTETVACSRADGFGVEMLRMRNIPMAVISRERNPVVERRCGKLGLECLQARDDKPAALRALCERWGASLSGIIYVGNDVADIACLEAAGLGVAVADAHVDARATADLVLTHRGGYGAVRELCELVTAALDRT
jgi:YrbI family 3-deoxy-D-manno-octulosonate 8-phosphate phosphatase